MAVKVVTEKDTFQNGQFYPAGSTLLFTGEAKDLPKWMKPADGEVPVTEPAPAKNDPKTAKDAAAAEAARKKAEDEELARLEAEEKARLEKEEADKKAAADAKAPAKAGK